MTKWIKTVQKKSNDYLVNNKIMAGAGGTDSDVYKSVQEWLKTNTPEAEFTASELLAMGKDKILVKLRTDFSTANSVGISYMGSLYQADKKSVDAMNSYLATGKVPPNFFWLDANNVEVPMTFSQLQKLSLLISTRNLANFSLYQSAKNSIMGASTVKALGKINIKGIVWQK